MGVQPARVPGASVCALQHHFTVAGAKTMNPELERRLPACPTRPTLAAVVLLIAHGGGGQILAVEMGSWVSRENLS